MFLINSLYYFGSSRLRSSFPFRELLQALTAGDGDSRRRTTPKARYPRQSGNRLYSGSIGRHFARDPPASLFFHHIPRGISPYYVKRICSPKGDQIPLLYDIIARSALRNSASRASSLARTTLKTEVCIDLILAIALRNSTYRALTLAGTARQTCIRNYICHIIYPPLSGLRIH